MLHEAPIGRIERSRQTEILARKRRHGLCVFQRVTASTAAPPCTPPSPNPLVVPYFLQNDNASGTGYRECFSSSCAMLAAYMGARSAAMTPTTSSAPVRRQHRGRKSPALQPCVRRAGGQLFHQRRHRRSDQRDRAGRPVPPAWLHRRAQLPGPRAAATWTWSPPYPKRVVDPTISTVTANLTQRWLHSNLTTARTQTTAPRTGSPLGPGGKRGWFLVAWLTQNHGPTSATLAGTGCLLLHSATSTRASLVAIAATYGSRSRGLHAAAMIVETGSLISPTLDVIEAGRGGRRGPCSTPACAEPLPSDAAREQALSEGMRSNSNEWQENLLRQEYAGLHDPAEVP